VPCMGDDKKRHSQSDECVLKIVRKYEYAEPRDGSGWVGLNKLLTICLSYCLSYSAT
jgi:hypothetical protein